MQRKEPFTLQPLYLSHILLFSADVDAARAFYEDVLGLRLSDKSGSVIAFLRSSIRRSPPAPARPRLAA